MEEGMGRTRWVEGVVAVHVVAVLHTPEFHEHCCPLPAADEQTVVAPEVAELAIGNSLD